MKEEESLRSAFDATAQRYLADPQQARTQDQLATMLSVVDAFRAEGFPVSLQVRPEHDGCAITFTDETKLRKFFANGNIKAGEVSLQFAFGQRRWDNDVSLLVTWDGQAVMNRSAVSDDKGKSWREQVSAVYPYNGMDGEILKIVAENDFRAALSALLVHVLVKDDLARRFNGDIITLDKQASLPPPARLKAPQVS